jgi:hypothetical protein
MLPFSMMHRAAILRSDVCGCYYCLNRFAPAEIAEWADADQHGVGQTALCPRCGIDSVVGSAGGPPPSDEVLRAMHARAFG